MAAFAVRQTGSEHTEAITPSDTARDSLPFWRVPAAGSDDIDHRDPESDEVTKKVTISTIAGGDASDVWGRCSRKTNRAVGSSVVTAEVISPPRSLSSISSAELPKILNQKNVNPAGISNTSTNSRIAPAGDSGDQHAANGDREIHQPQ